MKTPITYYGGKQRLSKKIISLIPDHACYVEPFFGGGAVYFAKEPSEVEVINDKNKEVVNFYKILKHDFDSLNYLLEETLYSRAQFDEAKRVYKNPENYSEVKRAWAFFVVYNESFSKNGGTWGFGKKNTKDAKAVKNKIDHFKDFIGRLRLTHIECDDALKVIKRFDTENTFFYLDPPYIGTDQRCYKGYKEDDFKALLYLIKTIKGKFLLSSYHNDLLDTYIKDNGWEYREVELRLLAKTQSNSEIRTEVLTANYSLSNNSNIGFAFSRAAV
jgi:DNA adenine methylase